jgi:hypothetical protein
MRRSKCNPPPTRAEARNGSPANAKHDTHLGSVRAQGRTARREKPSPRAGCMQKPSTSEYTRGAPMALPPWSSGRIYRRVPSWRGERASRHGTSQQFGFGVAGLLLLPYVMRKGLALERLGWTGLAAIVIGCGAPMVLLVNVGLLLLSPPMGALCFPASCR